MTLQTVNHIQGGDGLALGVLGVGDRVPNDILQEHLQDTAGLFVNQSRNTLDTPTTGQTANGGLRDALDVVAHDLPVALSSSYSVPLFEAKTG